MRYSRKLGFWLTMALCLSSLCSCSGDAITVIMRAEHPEAWDSAVLEITAEDEHGETVLDHELTVRPGRPRRLVLPSSAVSLRYSLSAFTGRRPEGGVAGANTWHATEDVVSPDDRLVLFVNDPLSVIEPTPGALEVSIDEVLLHWEHEANAEWILVEVRDPATGQVFLTALLPADGGPFGVDQLRDDAGSLWDVEPDDLLTRGPFVTWGAPLPPALPEVAIEFTPMVFLDWSRLLVELTNPVTRVVRFRER